MARSLLLSCEAISKAYGTRPLFEDLSFGLFEGDHVGLVGPNGSGKSTLLKILAGLETPDRGTRSLRGGIRVGYVPQDPVFPAGGTVEEVIAAALTRVDEDERPGGSRTPWAAPGSRTAARPVDTLSGGWQKRLAIARELAARARRPADGRAHQPPRRRRHPLAGGAARRPGARRPRGEPRPLLPRERGHAHARARTAPTRAASSRPTGGTATSSSGATSSCAARPPTRSRSPTPSAARSSGCGAGAKARTTKAKGRIKEAAA